MSAMSADSSKLNALAKARESLGQGSPARDRLAILFDTDSFVELDSFVKSGGEAPGVITGYGTIEGSPVYAFSQDSSSAGGAVGRAQAAKIRKLYDLAVKTGAPVVGIYDSNGGRVAEGNDVLNAYGEMLLWSNNLSGVVPQVSAVLGVCAGSAAMVALCADFVVMSEKAQLFMTPPFTAKAKGEAAEGAGTAANAAKAGMVHCVAPDDKAALEEVRKIISMMPLNNLSASPVCEFTVKAGADEALQAACENMDGADALEIMENVFDAGSVLELQKGFGTGAVTALATLGGSTVGVVAATGEEICPGCCAKIARLVSICDAYQIPVVTLLNTKGFMVSARAELHGMVREAAKVAHVYAEATTPKVAVITGQACGAAYVAMASRNANADVTLAWPSAVISPLAPETAVAMLYADEITAEKSREEVVAEFKAAKASPFQAAAEGYIENVIDPADTRGVLISTLDMLAGKRVSNLPKKHGNMPL